MTRLPRVIGATVLTGSLLSGCVAVAVPVALSGAIVRTTLNTARERNAKAPKAAMVQAADPATAGEGYRVLKGVTVLPAPDGSTPRSEPATTTSTVPDTMRYLYGSGEAAVLSIQAYQALAAYVTGPVAYTRKGKQTQTVLSEGSTLQKPYFEACGEKRPAVVLDVDETALLNIGYEADAAVRGVGYDAARWARWEATGAGKVVAVPGAKAALDTIRKAGVTVIFNSNRSAANADATARALDGAGLGPAVHNDTLFLRGDDGGTGSGKDVRRWAIASGYCVVAQVGDQLGDFSDLFNDPQLTPARRRAAAIAPPFAQMWGNGWFLLPNPVYGTGVAGNMDDVFPPDLRWQDTPPAAAPEPAK